MSQSCVLAPWSQSTLKRPYSALFLKLLFGESTRIHLHALTFYFSHTQMLHCPCTPHWCLWLNKGKIELIILIYIVLFTAETSLRHIANTHQNRQFYFDSCQRANKRAVKGPMSYEESVSYASASHCNFTVKCPGTLLYFFAIEQLCKLKLYLPNYVGLKTYSPIKQPTTGFCITTKQKLA